MDKTKTAIYAQVTPMIDCGMLVKQDKSTYTTTTLGKLAYCRWKGNSKVEFSSIQSKYYAIIS